MNKTKGTGIVKSPPLPSVYERFAQTDVNGRTYLLTDALNGRVMYPNYGHDKPNAASNFWVYSAKDGWQMYGGGHVTRDATQIAPDPGVALVWAMGAGVSLGNAEGLQFSATKTIPNYADSHSGPCYQQSNEGAERR